MIYVVVSVGFNGDQEYHGMFYNRRTAEEMAAAVKWDPDVHRVTVFQGEPNDAK